MFWIREIAGWILVAIALYLIRLGLLFLMDIESPKIVEAAIVTVGGLGVMRGGIALIRVSTAATLFRKSNRPNLKG